MRAAAKRVWGARRQLHGLIGVSETILRHPQVAACTAAQTICAREVGASELSKPYGLRCLVDRLLLLIAKRLGEVFLGSSHGSGSSDRRLWNHGYARRNIGERSHVFDVSL